MAPLITFSSFSFLALSLYTQYSVAEPGVVGLTLEKRQVDPKFLKTRKLRKRSNAVQSTLYNSLDNGVYFINTTVGTPPQSITLQLDTGSSDIWIPWTSSTVCQSGTCQYGAFDPTKSSSFVDWGADEFDINYVDTTEIKGDYINETFGIGGATIEQMTMALAKTASLPGGSDQPFFGIVGVSFDQEESAFQESEGQDGYPDIIHQMVSQGVIATKAYSLWLNDLDASQGSILFGGVDTAKYNGDLVVLPLQQDSDTGIIDSMTVTFNSLEVDGAGGKSVYSASATVPVILDSGTTLTFLPDDIALAILQGVGGINDNQLGPTVPCSVANTAGVIKFKFGDSNGPVISASVSQFVLPFGTDSPKFSNGEAACLWGLQPASGNPNLFGDTFLRSAYVVYNLDGKSIAIAETNFNATDSKIVQITDANSIPGASSTATGVASQTHSGAVFQTQTLGGVGGNTAIGSSATGTWDLGVATATGGSATSTGHKGAAAGLTAPSASIVGTIVAGTTVLFAMLSGSMLIFF